MSRLGRFPVGMMEGGRLTFKISFIHENIMMACPVRAWVVGNEDGTYQGAGCFNGADVNIHADVFTVAIAKDAA